MATGVVAALQQLPRILFLSGNHEWLRSLHDEGRADVVPVDPFGAFHHVVCGHVREVAGQRVAFLGLIEAPGRMDFDEAAYSRLLATEPGTVDVLVTHDGP